MGLKIKLIDYQKFKNSILYYIHGNDPVNKNGLHFEMFMIRHRIIGGSFDDIVNRRKNKKQIAKQIISNVLCWIYAIRMIVDLIIFTKINDKTLINYLGYFGNAFGHDKVSITVLSFVLLAMISSFHTIGKLNYILKKYNLTIFFKEFFLKDQI